MNDCVPPCAGLCVQTTAPLSHTGDGSGAGAACLQLTWDGCDAIVGGPCQAIEAVLLPAVPATATTPYKPARSLLFVERWSGNVDAVTIPGSSTVTIPDTAIHKYMVRSDFAVVDTGGCDYQIESQVWVNGVSATSWQASAGIRTVYAEPGETVTVEWRLTGDTSCVTVVDTHGFALETSIRTKDCQLPSEKTCAPTAGAKGISCGLVTVNGITSVNAAQIAGFSQATSLQAVGQCGLRVLVDGTTVTRNQLGELQVGIITQANYPTLCRDIRQCISAVGPLHWDPVTGVMSITQSNNCGHGRMAPPVVSFYTIPVGVH